MIIQPQFSTPRIVPSYTNADFNKVDVQENIKNTKYVEDVEDEDDEFYECNFCDRVFNVSNYASSEIAWRACDQHEESAHQEEEEFVPEPPVDTPGSWVTLEEFKQLKQGKSFGYFTCKCGKFWVSAHAQVKYKQGCKSCEKKSLPVLLWINYGSRRENLSDKLQPPQSPHDTIRCEACKAGDCIARPQYV